VAGLGLALGALWDQAPAAADTAAGGVPVPPVTSRGYPYTEIGVPQVVGLRLARAEREIGRSGLHYTVHWRSATGVPRGVVVAEQPGGSTVVGENAVIALTASAGPGRHPPRP